MTGQANSSTAFSVERQTRTLSSTRCANLLKQLGFVERVRGDHHIFTKDGISEILNLHPKKHHAKAYQVKQVQNVILQYKLAGEKDAK